MGIASGAGTLNIKYSKKVYDQKIAQLERYGKQLETHRANLESYRNQIKNHWADEKAEEYYRLLSKQILAVKNATNRILTFKETLQSASDEFEQSDTIIGGILDEIESSLNILGIGAD